MTKTETVYGVMRLIVSLAAGLILGGYLAGFLFPMHSDVPIEMLWVLWAVLFVVITKASHWAIGQLRSKNTSAAN